MNRTLLSFIIVFGLALQSCAGAPERRYSGTPYRPPCRTRHQSYTPQYYGGGDLAGLFALITIFAALASIGSSDAYDYAEGNQLCLN